MNNNYKTKMNGYSHPAVKPEVYSAVLFCELCYKPTTHNFSHAFSSEANGHHNPRRKVNVYYNLIYECSTCNSSRVWGLMSP